MMVIGPSEKETRKQSMWEIAGPKLEQGWSGCKGDSRGLGSVRWSTRGSTCNPGDNICPVLGACQRVNRGCSWRSGFERAFRG